MAKPNDVIKEMKDNCTAFQVLSPRIPNASGINVIAFNKINTRIGTKTFFNLDFFRAEK